MTETAPTPGHPDRCSCGECNPRTVRVIIAMDVPASQLHEAYEGTIDAQDLEDSLAARLSEFYPANDGYALPTRVVAVMVDDDEPVSREDLAGAYIVGIEGARG